MSDRPNSYKRDGILVLCGLAIGLALYSPEFINAVLLIIFGSVGIVALHFLACAIPHYWKFQRLDCLKRHRIETILRGGE